jgi:gliding motility-associated-like protein
VSSTWTFDSLGTYEGRNTAFVFPNEVGDDYTVCLDVVSLEGCTDQLCRRVVIADDFYIYVPNTFTPNGDGLNDLFGPVLSFTDVVEYRFWIVNRKGRLVFETNDPNQKWNGSGIEEDDYFEGGNVYIWQMIAKPDFNVETKKYIGQVLMLR